MRVGLLIISGLLLWLVTQFLAVGLGGAGHGWVTPFFATLPLAILYPLAVADAFMQTTGGRLMAVAVIVAAIPLDVYLLWATLDEAGYFLNALDSVPVFVVGCFALWIGWQALGLWSIFRPAGGLSK